jgi:hypothetical protein
VELAESERARGEREMGLGGKGARRDKSAKMHRNLLHKFFAKNEAGRQYTRTSVRIPKGQLGQKAIDGRGGCAIFHL